MQHCLLIFLQITKINFIKVLGVLVGFSGIVFLFSDNVLINESNFFSAFLILVGSTFYVIGGLLTIKISNKKNENVTASILIWATIFLIPVTAYTEQPWNLNPSMESTISVIYLGVVATGFAWLLRFRIFNKQWISFSGTSSISNSNFWCNFRIYIFKRVNYTKSINRINRSHNWNLFSKKIKQK